MRQAGLYLAVSLALGLQIASIHAHSLSGDGAYHLLAGHQALRYGQNTVNFEHPPLAKLLFSLPLLLEEEPLDDPVRVEEAISRANGIYSRGEMIRRATLRGRYVALVFFVLPFLLACFVLGRRFGNPATGAVLLLMTALSISVLPYLTILQTDTAISLAYLLTVLAGAAYIERPGWRQALLLAMASGLALAVKFSGLLLGPTVLVCILIAKISLPWRLAHLALMGGIVLLIVEASYFLANRNYDPELGREMIRTYCANRGTLAVDGRMTPLEDPLLSIERLDPRLAQWLTGFLGVRIQNSIGVYPSYAFGEIRSEGRWWYFPTVLAIKTPLVILLVALLALGASLGKVTWPKIVAGLEKHRAAVPLGVTVVVYLAASITSNYNLSIRHMLPILPMLYLPIAQFAARRPSVAAFLVGVLAIESLALAPLWMSATNTWWMGEENPTRFALGAGNLEYRQNFPALARVAEKERLEPLFVLYPALPDEVLHPYLPEAQMTRPGEALQPGWYAVNVTVEQLVPALLAASPHDVYNFAELRHAAESWQPFWRQVVEMGEDHGWAAGTFHLYRIP